MSYFASFLTNPSLGSFYSFVVANRQPNFTGAISYGDHERHKFDIYFPARNSDIKAAIFFIYGGGWNAGHRTMYGFVGSSLAAQGYLTIVPDYRLHPEALYPDFMIDVSAAYRFSLERVRKELGRNIPVFLSGHSAGAHMAALLCYNSKYFKSDGQVEVCPSGFIGISGPYGFDAKTHKRTRDIFINARDNDAVRPVAQVVSGAAPALLFHGSKDRVVLSANAIRLAQALGAVGSFSKVIELEQASHIDPILGLSRPFVRKYAMLPTICDFIDLVINK